MSWIKYLSSVELTGSQATEKAPNQTNTAALFERAGSANSYAYREEEVTCEKDEYYTFSVFVKADDATHMNLLVGEAIDDNFCFALFNLDQGLVEDVEKQSDTSHITEVDSVLTSVGDGWFNAQIGFKCLVEFDASIYLSSRKSEGLIDAADDEGASSMYLWNFSVENRKIETNTSYLGSGLFGYISSAEHANVHVPVWSSDTVSVEYKDTFGNLQAIEVETPENFETKTAVEYVVVPSTTAHGFPKEYFINDNQGDTYQYTVNREKAYNKYEPTLCTFVNHRGVLEDFWFTRKSEYMMDVKTSMFQKNTIDYNSLSYDVYGHTKQQFDVMGTKKVKLHTDYVDQRKNLFLEHMLMSEYVWLTNSGGTVPVIVTNKSMKYKTHVNDKLVSYDITFEYANRLDNKIR